jgi:hypothetical protein
MIELETRLRALADTEVRPPAPPGALREIVRGRRRRRRGMVATAATAVALLLIGTVWTRVVDDESSQQVTAGPKSGATSTSIDPSARFLGGLTGVHVGVSPRVDLLDGQTVDVRVDGLDHVPGAHTVMCAGDVTEETAMTSCDLTSGPDGSGGLAQLTASEQAVRVQRVIHITRGSPDPNQVRTYDCAVEPAGCVLAVGPLTIPVRAALVAVTFQDVPLATPTASISPSTGLRDGQEAIFTAEGLRPDTTYAVTQCQAQGERGCDVLDFGSATTDPAGRVTIPVSVWASIYRYNGRVDCTAEPCAVTLTMEGLAVVSTPVAFAEGVVAPVPSLRIEPTGPYRDGQHVTVRGSGFRPGHSLLGEIGQCPADKDTATEERCGYDLWTSVADVVPDADGRFTTTVRLVEQLAFTGTCRGEPGCVLGWVIPHGTTLAKVRLTFSA